ncbi:hypothetical protein, partial [Vreelandella aquamarina]|uniref:hypothetical protein n=1 Tax=Vreelandella aquamarina TaxID=77097 RepID=UPI001C3F89D5
ILITHLGKPRLPPGVKDGHEQVRDYEEAIYSLNGNTFETPMKRSTSRTRKDVLSSIGGVG